MNGSSLLTYIEQHFIHENELHKDLIEIQIMNQKIKTNASDFIIEIERLIAEANRLGANINSDEKLKTCLTKALMESDKYHSFYQTLIASSSATAATPIATVVRELKSKIITFDINEATITTTYGNKRKKLLVLTGKKNYNSKTISPNKSKANSNKLCKICKKRGHLARECYSNRNNSNPSRNDSSNPRTKAKTWKGKMKFQSKQYFNLNRDNREKNANLKCFKCGGNHYANECRTGVNNHDKIGNKDQQRNLMHIDEVSDQDGEIYGNNRTVEFVEEPPLFLRSLVNEDMDLGYESDGPGSSSRVFSYPISNYIDKQPSQIKTSKKKIKKSIKRPFQIKQYNLRSKSPKDKIKALQDKILNCTGNECAYIDSGCSKTSLNNRKFFSMVQQINKIVQSASGKMTVNYLGQVGPLDGVYWIPKLTDNLISMADLINLGMTILITPDGLMNCSLGKMEIFKVKMENNVWSIDINMLLEILNLTFGIKPNSPPVKIRNVRVLMLTRSKVSRGGIKRNETPKSVPLKTDSVQPNNLQQKAFAPRNLEPFTSSS